jgi:hypothetical protein
MPTRIPHRNANSSGSIATSLVNPVVASNVVHSASPPLYEELLPARREIDAGPLVFSPDTGGADYGTDIGHTFHGSTENMAEAASTPAMGTRMKAQYVP